MEKDQTRVLLFAIQQILKNQWFIMDLIGRPEGQAKRIKRAQKSTDRMIDEVYEKIPGLAPWRAGK